MFQKGLQGTHPEVLQKGVNPHMKDYITITLSKEEAVALARDLLSASQAYRLQAVQANHEFTVFKSRYFAERLAETQQLVAEHEAILPVALDAIVAGGVTCFDIHPHLLEVINDK